MYRFLFWLLSTLKHWCALTLPYARVPWMGIYHKWYPICKTFISIYRNIRIRYVNMMTWIVSVINSPLYLSFCFGRGFNFSANFFCTILYVIQWQCNIFDEIIKPRKTIVWVKVSTDFFAWIKQSPVPTIIL